MSNEIKLVVAGVGIVVAGFVAGHQLRKRLLQKMRDAKIKKTTPDAVDATKAKKAEVDNVAAFNAMMIKYKVPVDNNIQVGGTGYLDKPVKDRLFCGTDIHGRVFINLPYITLVNDGENVDTYVGSMVAFQRYTDNQSVFVTGGARTPMIGDLFGPTNRDLSYLEELLSGDTIRLVDPVRKTSVSVTLKR